jgi:hypothetical protein
MTARRLSIDPPLASTGWAARKAPKFAVTYCSQCGEEFGPGDSGFSHCDQHPKPAWLIKSKERADLIEAIWRTNMARRDAAAAAYGEPETPHEFYAGRPGSQAETIVCDCLRALQAIPEIDRLFADLLMDRIAKVYLATAPDGKTEVRRASALLRIAGERA